MIGTFFCYDGGEEFGKKCMDVCEATGFERVPMPQGATFAIAPRLTKKLGKAEWSAPELGTLIFHPSILPYHRGPDAIRWTVANSERVSGVTWFWCDDGLDTGPICEQEPVLLKPGESPGRAYHTRFVPAGLRALDRAVVFISAIGPRRIPQDEELASYEGRWPVLAIAPTASGCRMATANAPS
jgi:methionyl-tRNA formyltransferase